MMNFMENGIIQLSLGSKKGNYFLIAPNKRLCFSLRKGKSPDNLILSLDMITLISNSSI